MSNTKTSILRQQYGMATNNLLHMTEGITDEIAHASPGGVANSIAATLAHLVVSNDRVVNAMLKGGTPLMATMSTGLSEPPPAGRDTFNWYDWGTRVKVNLPETLTYAKAVFASVDTYLAELEDGDLDSVHQTPGGETTTFYFLNGAMLFDIISHTGEISALKGQHGLKGYVM